MKTQVNRRVRINKRWVSLVGSEYGLHIANTTIPRRWLPLLVRLKGKSPAINGKGWLERALERDELDPQLPAHLASGGNVGIVVPPGYIVIDPDNDSALSMAEEELDPRGGPRAETGSGKAHYWFRLPKELHGQVASGEFQYNGITFDSKADGSGQMVIAPSTHPDTGLPYSWIRPLRGTRIPVLPASWRRALKPKGPKYKTSTITTTPWDGKLPDSVELIAINDPEIAQLIHPISIELPILAPLTHPISPYAFSHSVKSESQWDMVLACHLVRRDVDPSEIEHALRYRRARVKGKKKSDAYFRHTVEKAIAFVKGTAEA